MKKFTPILFVVLLLASNLFAQKDSLQKQINEQVWKPFIQSFNSGDDNAFRAVHSKDVIRVIRDNSSIIGYNEYFRTVPDSIKAKWGTWKKNIELRFTQRIAANGKAFETGYYKTSNTNTSTGEKRVGYGKFLVLLRKENGTWKILVDADSNEKTNEEVFMTGEPME